MQQQKKNNSFIFDLIPFERVGNHVYFRSSTLEKAIDHFIPPTMDDKIPLNFFWKGDLPVKLRKNTDMTLHKETTQNRLIEAISFWS